MMKLVIAEKPQLGQVIAEAIGIISRKDGFFECKNGYVVTWAIGHLLAQKMPKEINPIYEKWDLSTLPFNFPEIPLKVKPQVEKQFKVVEKLLSNADTAINAGDPDDEGQLLIDELLDFCQFKGKQERILLNDMNIDSAKEALKNIQSNTAPMFVGMKNKALARSRADYIFGLNLTMAYTTIAKKTGYTGIFSVGRVQTPTLALIVRRYLANKNHKESFYYNVNGQFKLGAKVIDTKLIVDDKIETDPNNEKEKRIISETVANGIKSACENKTASIHTLTIEDKKAPAPLPFSLLDLQVKISNKYGYTSDDVLKITQDLREKHKAITYNRSDCRYLSTQQFEQAPATIEHLKSQYAELASLPIDTQQKSRAFNDKNITAHTGIIPVKGTYQIADMTQKEKNVFKEIVNQYLGQFMPEKSYQQATVILQCENYQFKTGAIKTINKGWELLVTEDDETAENDTIAFDTLASLNQGENGICAKINVNKEKTKPAPLFTEATLLKALQSIAKEVKSPDIRQLLIDKDKDKKGENGGIGTPATRSAIIKNLLDNDYFKYQGKQIVPTDKALQFIEKLPDTITYPDMTALWFEQQTAIEKGELSIQDFLKGVQNFIAEHLESAKNVKLELTGEPCECGKGVLMLKKGSKGSFFACSNYPECNITKPALNDLPMPNCPCCNGNLKANSAVIECVKCGLKIWRKISEKNLTDSQIMSLLSKGKTTLIKGFKSKTGKDFEAYLKLNKAEKKVELDFPTREMKVVKVKREDLKFK